jgi:hypothetical protein
MTTGRKPQEVPGYLSPAYYLQASQYTAQGCDGKNGLENSLRQAVARGWSADINRHKQMDCDLAETIVQEICSLLMSCKSFVRSLYVWAP